VGRDNGADTDTDTDTDTDYWGGRVCFGHCGQVTRASMRRLRVRVAHSFPVANQVT
jgi:hypothetical protein